MIEMIVPIIIGAIALVGITKNQDGLYLSVEQGNSLKGISALLLVIVHIRERLMYIPISYKGLASIGFCLVAAFFFYSGYGIIKQAIYKPRYITERLPRRIIYLIELIVVSEIIYYVIDILVFNREFSYIDMIKCITGYTMLNGAMWTVVAMLVIQIVLYCVCVVRNNNKNYSLISAIGVIVYIAFTLLRGRRGAWEMQSCLAFVLGAFIAEHESVINKKINDSKSIFKYLILFLITYSMPYIIRFLFNQDLLVVRVLFGSICSCAFIMIMLWLTNRVKISNSFTKYIGTMFTEVYLFHGIILDLMKFYYPSYFASNDSTILSIILLFIVVGVSALIKELKRLIRVAIW